MRIALSLSLVLLLAACGGGSSAPVVPRVSDPSQYPPAFNGEAFSLATAVPVYNDAIGTTKTQVGTASSGIAPLISSTGQTDHLYYLNGNTSVSCNGETLGVGYTISEFDCNGNPFA